VALLGTTVATYIIGDGARATYVGLTDPKADYDGPYNTWATMATINNYSYIAFGLVYVYGLADAIIYAKPSSSHRAMFNASGTEMAALDLKLNAMGTPMLKAKLLEF
jgi:hypothetical protein